MTNNEIMIVPHIAIRAEINLPITVLGTKSPKPTLIIVEKENQNVSSKVFITVG